MNPSHETTEASINRLLDRELQADAEHELNRALIRNPEMMELRRDYELVDQLAGEVLSSVRSGAAIDMNAVFGAPRARIPIYQRTHRGWLMIPGAVAAALLAIVIPEPNLLDNQTPSTFVGESSPFAGQHEFPWNGEQLVRPVSDVPRIRSQTGRDVIGVVGEDGNLYWIEVERKRTIRWPAGEPAANESM